MAGAVIAARLSLASDDVCGRIRAALAVLALCAFAAIALAAPQYPELAGRVTDEARLLTPSEKADIERELAAIEQTSTDQIAVVTVTSLQGYPIEDYGIGLARKWGIGQKGKDNGLLLIVAPNDHKVRIEVGRRLEPLMTDTMAALIIQNAILPKFRRGDYAGGIKDAIRDIKTVLLGNAEEVTQRAQGARTPHNDPMVLTHLLIWFAIIAFIIWINYRNMSSLGPDGRRRMRRNGGIIFIPGGSGNWGGGWSGRGGGGGWSGRGGGGGWSGGGGSFGGGGASGSW